MTFRWSGRRSGFGAEPGDEVSPVRALVQKYKDRPMDLGDACYVRLAELVSGSVVYTVDKKAFMSYRKNGRQPVPCIFPMNDGSIRSVNSK